MKKFLKIPKVPQTTSRFIKQSPKISSISSQQKVQSKYYNIQPKLQQRNISHFSNQNNSNNNENQQFDQNFSPAFKEWQGQVQEILGELGKVSEENVNFGKQLELEQKILKLTFPLLSQIEEKGIKDNEAHILMIFISDSCYNAGNLLGIHLEQSFKDAIELMEQALKLRIELHGADDAKVQDVHFNLGRTYIKQGGNGQKALEHLSRALEINEKNNDQTRSLRIIDCTAIAQYQLGNMEDALSIHKQALQIVESKLGKDNHLTADSLCGIGLIQGEQGNYEEGIEYLERAIQAQQNVTEEQKKIMEKTQFQYENPLYKVYQNLGKVYGLSGDHEKAIFNYHLALDQQKQNLQSNHQSFFTTFLELSNHQLKLERYDEANVNINKANLILIQKYIVEQRLDQSQVTPDVIMKAYFQKPKESIQLYLDMSKIEIHKKQLDNAKKNLMAALQISKKIFGEQNEKTKEIQQQFEKFQKEHNQQ